MATEIRAAGAKPWGSNSNLLTAVPKADSQHLQGVGHLPAFGPREAWEQQGDRSLSSSRQLLEEAGPQTTISKTQG